MKGSKQCDCCPQIAVHKVDVQTNWFRGDDEVFKLCAEHYALIKAGEIAALFEFQAAEKARRRSLSGAKKMNLIGIDLRTVTTTVRLTQPEKMAAQMRHLAAMNDAQLAEKKARNARRGLVPMVIGSLYVPPRIARHFTHSDSVGGV